jgi:hypothetical protein
MNALSMSNQQVLQRRAVAPRSNSIGMSGVLAGLVGGVAMMSSAMLLAGAYGSSAWSQLQAIGGLLLGPSAVAQAGFAAGPALAGLLIGLAVLALLGALFGFVTRQVLRLPSDYGVPAVTGLTFGLLIWLAGYVVAALLPQMMLVFAPALLIQYIVYGIITGLVLAVLRPQPFAAATL